MIDELQPCCGHHDQCNRTGGNHLLSSLSALVDGQMGRPAALPQFLHDEAQCQGTKRSSAGEVKVIKEVFHGESCSNIARASAMRHVAKGAQKRGWFCRAECTSAHTDATCSNLVMHLQQSQGQQVSL